MLLKFKTASFSLFKGADVAVNSAVISGIVHTEAEAICRLVLLPNAFSYVQAEGKSIYVGSLLVVGSLEDLITKINE
jgi:hypothetical protein